MAKRDKTFWRGLGQKLKPLTGSRRVDDIDKIDFGGMFNADYYLSTYPEVENSGLKPLEHYLRIGWLQGYDPSENFSTAYYLRTNGDVAESGINPLSHYMLYGHAEGRNPLPPPTVTLPKYGKKSKKTDTGELIMHARLKAVFDADFYMQLYQDLVPRGEDPFTHYMHEGWKLGCDPSRDFSTDDYLDAHPEVVHDDINPLLHALINSPEQFGYSPETPQDKTDIATATTAETVTTSKAAPVKETKTDAPIVMFIPDEVREAFDESFYRTAYPDIDVPGVDPIQHYMQHGWRELRDPSPHFSTEYYLENNPDIAKAGVNPFSHYCQFGIHEKREPKSYSELRSIGFSPLVSVIIPNYNHAKYLPQRLQCIFEQTYRNFEIIILDDCSKDDSRDVIEKIVEGRDEDITLHFNEKNSGNVFSQWQKGLSLAKGDLIWICESDDYAELDFLEKMVRHFSDESVGMAFGGIQFCDTDGNKFDGLDPWRERAEPGIWDDVTARPAAEWFANGWGVNNLYANVGGGVFRNQTVDEAIWKEAKTYKICGDWYLYLQLAGGGKVVSDPEAVAYFRQHGENTSAANFNKAYYYDEHIKILRAIIDKWGIPKKTRKRFIENIKFQYNHFKMDEKEGAFDDYFPVEELLKRERKQEHIQIFFLGFHEGGGELLPIMMANGFKEKGYTVSMVGVELGTINEDMRSKLQPGIGVYHISDIAETGRAAFFENCGVSVIHSHMVSCDAKLASFSKDPFEVPYVVSLHGSYEGMADGNEAVLWNIMRNVTEWVYTADKNLGFVKGMPLDPARFHKIPNAMPRDDRDFPQTRKELGISEDAVVFTLVARGIKQKGWRASVEAFQSLAANNPKKDLHLILVGTGEEADKAGEKVAKAKNISWLGYQSNINGLYRLSDCAIVPTRFGGESFPLCIIQALQEKLPVIATDTGEIKSMLTDGDNVAGVLIENERDTQKFFVLLETAMKKMLTKTARKKASSVAARCAKRFDMGEMLDAYIEIYDKAKARLEAQKAGKLSTMEVKD